MATLAFKFEAYKTAREGFEKLQTLKIPPKWVSQIEVMHLKLRSKPFQDKESLIMTCNRCISQNPLTNNRGDFCVTCGNPTIRNFTSFDSLPLVEFVPDPSVPPVRVKELLR